MKGARRDLTWLWFSLGIGILLVLVLVAVLQTLPRNTVFKFLVGDTVIWYKREWNPQLGISLSGVNLSEESLKGRDKSQKTTPRYILHIGYARIEFILLPPKVETE